MTISGLILTLSAEENLAAQAIASVRSRPEFLLGERNNRWQTVAMEARDDAECRARHDWLNALPGVEFVEVAYVNFEEEEASASLTPEVTYEH